MGGSLATPKVGQLSWTTFVENSINENIIGEISWKTLLRDSLGTLYWETLLGSYLGKFSWHKHIGQTTTSEMQFPHGNCITIVSPSVFDIHTRDNTSFVFWQIVKPTRFVSISFHKKKGGDVIECCLFSPPLQRSLSSSENQGQNMAHFAVILGPHHAFRLNTIGKPIIQVKLESFFLEVASFGAHRLYEIW